MAGYFIARTAPNREAVVARRLSQRGFAPYLPETIIERRGGREFVAQPFLPTLLFVVDEGCDPLTVVQGSGADVCGLPRVTRDVVDRIRAREFSGYVDLIETRAPRGFMRLICKPSGFDAAFNLLFRSMRGTARTALFLALLKQQPETKLAA